VPVDDTEALSKAEGVDAECNDSFTLTPVGEAVAEALKRIDGNAEK
jgi:hypothetical protein